MSFWQKLMAAKNALNYGEQLNNAAIWKKSAIAIKALVGFITCVFAFVPEFQNVDPESVNDLAKGVFTLVGLYDMYIHKATSSKI